MAMTVTIGPVACCSSPDTHDEFLAAGMSAHATGRLAAGAGEGTAQMDWNSNGPMIIDKPLEAAPALQISVADIEAAHAELAGRGVPVGPIQHFVDGAPAEGPGGDYNLFVFFTDPDGNNWAVQQGPLLR